MRKPDLLISLTLGVMLSIAGMSACSMGKKSKPTTDGDLNPQAETQIELGKSSGAPQRGLELRVLTIDDTGDRVGRALAPYEPEPGAMREQDKELWRNWGLRWIVVPVDELDGFIGSQDLTKGVEIRWMGEFPQWRPLIRAGQINNQSVRIGASDYRTIDGRPSLLARVWTTPEITPEGVLAKLHLDLGVQMTKPKAKNPWEAPTHPSALDDGGLIEELSMSQQLDSSQAMILVGEDPLIRWIDQEGDDDELVSVESPTATSIGPSAPSVRTLGQRMLSTPGTGIVAPGQRYVAPKKVLIILVPKAGGQYRLLGPTSSASSDPGVGS